MIKFDPIIILLVGSLPLLVFSLVGLIRSIIAKNNEIKELSSRPAVQLKEEGHSKKLQDDLDKLKRDADDRIGQIAAKDAEIKRLNAQAAGMIARLDLLEKKISENKKNESDTGKIGREIAEHKQAAEALRAELARVKTGIADGETRLAEKDAEIKRLTGQLTAKDGERKALADRLTAREAEMSKSSEQLAAKESEAKRIMDQFIVKDAEIDQLAEQLAANYIEIKELNARLAELRAPRKLPEELAAKLGGVKSRTSGGSKLLAIESSEMELLVDQLAAKDAEIEHQKQTIENLHWEVDKLCAGSSKAAEQLAAKDAEIKRLRQNP